MRTWILGLVAVAAFGQPDQTGAPDPEKTPALPTVYASITISAKQTDPALERPLDAGINAGHHEGGGKSLEIRRFGFNLDHGGVSGGLKVLVDDVGRTRPPRATARATWGR